MLLCRRLQPLTQPLTLVTRFFQTSSSSWGRRYTKWEDDQILRLIAEKKHSREIGAILNRSPSSIKMRRTYIDPSRKPRPVQDRKGDRRCWTQEEKDLLLKLKASTDDWIQI